jgi:tRNA-specific 2-thiouridylase
MEAITKIRYKDKGALSNLNPVSSLAETGHTPSPGTQGSSSIVVETRHALSLQPQEQVQVRFYENVKGIAPGQSAVFYEEDDVIGGGIIQSGVLSR